jgi:hypothetical protein
MNKARMNLGFHGRGFWSGLHYKKRRTQQRVRCTTTNQTVPTPYTLDRRASTRGKSGKWRRGSPGANAPAGHFAAKDRKRKLYGFDVI